MGGSRFRSSFRAASLDQNDGLLERHFARRGKKRSGVAADRLHIKENAVRKGIISEVGDEIAPTHIGHGSDRDERAEAHPLAETPVEDGRAQSPALAKKRHFAR